MNSPGNSAVMTVAIGKAADNLDHTFTSFAQCPGMELHAFIIGKSLPQRQLPGITYHLVDAIPDFSHPLREVYFRRLELVDAVGSEWVLVVDSYDVLCLQPLPEISNLLGKAAVGGCVEHCRGGRFVMGQGYTSNFLNGGVIFWNARESREIRKKIVQRGRCRFRSVVDDQDCLNEVVQTEYFDRLTILPAQYNFRCCLPPFGAKGWPSTTHLDGVMIYHNAACIDAAKRLRPVRKRAVLPELLCDTGPLNRQQQFWRRLQARLKLWRQG